MPLSPPPLSFYEMLYLGGSSVELGGGGNFGPLEGFRMRFGAARPG